MKLERKDSSIGESRGETCPGEQVCPDEIGKVTVLLTASIFPLSGGAHPNGKEEGKEGMGLEESENVWNSCRDGESEPT